MGRLKLKHVLSFDDGICNDHSFTTDSATHSQESCRLLGDLALLTRPYGEIEGGVSFAVVEDLINEAADIINTRIEWMRGQLGLLKSDCGKLYWGRRNLLVEGQRNPTHFEVVNLEGESRILWDAIVQTQEGAKKSIRLLAAWGVFCCERAMDAETRSHIGTVIEMYAAAGVLLGSANYLLGCMAESGLGKDRYNATMRERGKRRWEDDPTQKAKAEMRAEWERWQVDHSLYAKPSLFRAKMLSAHNGIVPEGTLKNWMTGWRKEWRPSSC